MKTMILGFLAAGAASFAGAVGVGCVRPESTESVGQAAQALVGPLPAREFVQLPRMCAGATNDLDAFLTATPGVTNGTLVGTFDGAGRFSIDVREPDASVHPVAGLAHYLMKPVAIAIPDYRVACSARGALVDRGPGPRGEVFTYDKTQGTEIVCWYNPNGTTTWTEKVVARAAPGEPTDAFWPLIVTGAKIAGVEVPDAFEVVYLRDAEYAPWVRTSIWRAPREGAYFARVHLVTGQIEIFDQDTYPDWRDGARAHMGPVDCNGLCGFRTNGVDWAECGGCSGGESCHDGICRAGTGIPLTQAQACVDRPGEPACGERPDGCGGKITCSSCPAGLACGATGDLDYCGARPAPVGEAKLRELYDDVDGRLCGTVLDPATGTSVTLTSSCAQCVDNLCLDQPLPACIPSGGLDASPGGGQ
jgi:hypothetical protein